jgi:hypothetical protein
MGSIFVSYRREDGAPYAGRLYDRLSAYFGEARVFMDIDSIDVGNDFAAVLDRTLESCDALIVLIGPRWLTSRLDDPHDFVRLEIAAVLKRQIPIIPLLVGGAHMPREDDVPAVLAGLVRRQALTVSDERFHRDVSELIEALGRVGLQKPRPAAANISGKWHASGANSLGHAFTISLELEVMDDRLFGTVDYPTGSGAIQDGKIEGETISFFTEHVPQFETEKAIVRFDGKISGNELMLISHDRSSYAKFVARRV